MEPSDEAAKQIIISGLMLRVRSFKTSAELLLAHPRMRRAPCSGRGRAAARARRTPPSRRQYPAARSTVVQSGAVWRSTVVQSGPVWHSTVVQSGPVWRSTWNWSASPSERCEAPRPDSGEVEDLTNNLV